jgi:MFS family permease
MAFTNLAVFGGAFFTPILVGRITHSLMYWWTFYLVAIFCAVCLPLVILFCPETAYRRDAALNTDLLATDEAVPAKIAAEAPAQAPSERTSGADEEKHADAPSGGVGNAPGAGVADSNGVEAQRPAGTPQRVSFARSLMPFNGRKTDESFFKLLLSPFPLFLHPAFLWASLIQGTLIGWTVFIGVIMAQFFIGYPLWWDEVQTGYAYTGAFLGAILGFIVAGLLADWSAKFLTRLNKGVYEPEFRIALVIPQLVFGCMGLYGFGITLDGLLFKKFTWYIPVMFFGFEVCGMVIGAVASSLYIVDAYRKFSFFPLSWLPGPVLTAQATSPSRASPVSSSSRTSSPSA